MRAPLLLLAHGQPADPDRAEAEVAALSARVARHLPGWPVASATLAAPGALARAVEGLGPAPLVFPLFMAGGWFTRVQIPRRLAEAGAERPRLLEPLGCLPALHALAARVASEGARVNGASRILLAAHGSGQSPAPSAVARTVAARIAAISGLPTEAAFIEEGPRLRDYPAGGPAICLPYFAFSGAHVTHDLPEALNEARFNGETLPAIGLHPEIAALIADAARNPAPACTDACRFIT